MLPIQFEIIDQFNCKRHIAILGQFTQYYTKETIYKIRIHTDSGYVVENFAPESALKEMLKNRVKD